MPVPPINTGKQTPQANARIQSSPASGQSLQSIPEAIQFQQPLDASQSTNTSQPTPIQQPINHATSQPTQPFFHRQQLTNQTPPANHGFNFGSTTSRIQSQIPITQPSAPHDLTPIRAHALTKSFKITALPPAGQAPTQPRTPTRTSNAAAFTGRRGRRTRAAAGAAPRF